MTPAPRPTRRGRAGRLLGVAGSLAVLALSLAGVAAPAEAAGLQPVIDSVQYNLDAATHDIEVTVSGSGLGTSVPPTPFAGDSAYFVLDDITEDWNAGNLTSGQCVAGVPCGPDAEILGAYELWRSNEVVVSFDTTVRWAWKTGDKMYIGLENPQSKLVTHFEGSLSQHVATGKSPGATAPAKASGFPTTSLVLAPSSPYTKAQLSTVNAVKLTETISHGGRPVIKVAPLGLSQVAAPGQKAAGSLLRYKITPTNAFLKASAATQVTEGFQLVNNCLVFVSSLVHHYASALHTARVPWSPGAGLGSWWEVSLQDKTTTGAVNLFTVIFHITGTSGAKANGHMSFVYDATPQANESALVHVLAKQLYYSAAVAA